jgi:hypothetical protein
MTTQFSASIQKKLREISDLPPFKHQDSQAALPILETAILQILSPVVYM